MASKKPGSNPPNLQNMDVTNVGPTIELPKNTDVTELEMRQQEEYVAKFQEELKDNDDDDHQEISPVNIDSRLITSLFPAKQRKTKITDPMAAAIKKGTLNHAVFQKVSSHFVDWDQVSSQQSSIPQELINFYAASGVGQVINELALQSPLFVVDIIRHGQTWEEQNEKIEIVMKVIFYEIYTDYVVQQLLLTDMKTWIESSKKVKTNLYKLPVNIEDEVDKCVHACLLVCIYIYIYIYVSPHSISSHSISSHSISSHSFRFCVKYIYQTEYR